MTGESEDVANGVPAAPSTPVKAIGPDGITASSSVPKPKRPSRPNYAKIHAKALPLDVHPLPAFIPHSPLSLLRIAYVLLKEIYSFPTSHTEPCIGYFSSETRSVHITDPSHVRALWEMGFFGKGTLSRSEPSWLVREQARRTAGPGGSSEEHTKKRREDRRRFKLERARLEREQIEEQLRKEQGLLDEANGKLAEAAPGTIATSGIDGSKEAHGLGHVFPWENVEPKVPRIAKGHPLAHKEVGCEALQEKTDSAAANNYVVHLASQIVQDQVQKEQLDDVLDGEEEPEIDVNQEHLQLTLEEAFFLSYGLGSLRIFSSPDRPAMANRDVLRLFQTHSTFPVSSLADIRPDNLFMLHYVVYHHYRSLGWVVRPGVKFAVDYLLYNRGPVFSHAEFAVMIIPEYQVGDPRAKQSKDWWWLHCINRVQSQVRKSLVVCYVQVPTAIEATEVDELDIGALLRRYKVRDFVIRRWLANRSRD